MIYCGGESSMLPIISESIYLGEELSQRMMESQIFINPNNPTYIINKIVIININKYPLDKLNVLIKNKCKIISRVNIDSIESDLLEFSPYILRPCFDVNWNGKECTVDELDILKLEKNELDFIDWDIGFSEYKLYFPKIFINNLDKSILIDNLGNLTYLGWIFQQVGVNIIKDTPMKDLDLVKIKKMDFN